MSNPQVNSSWGFQPGKDASAILLDGYKRLAAAVCAQALADFHNKDDQLKSLDAFAWWLSEGALWLDSLGFEIDQDKILPKILERGYGRQRRFARID